VTVNKTRRRVATVKKMITSLRGPADYDEGLTNVSLHTPVPVVDNFTGKRLLTFPQILVIQKAFLQRFTFYGLLSVIKLLFFCYFFVKGDFLQ